MGRASYILTLAPPAATRIDGDAVASVPLAADAALPGAFAVSAKAALAELNYAGEGVLIAVPSVWCLSAPVSASGLPGKGRAAALLYRFEERLPLSVEEVAAAFVHGDGDEPLGVAVEAARLRPLVEALEAAGVAVDAVAPLGLLAVEGLAASDPAATDADLVLIVEGDRVNALRLGQRHVCSWSLVSAAEVELTRLVALRRLHTRPPLRVVMLGLDPPIADALAGIDGVELDARAPAPEVLVPRLVARGGAQALADRAAYTPNLRCGALAAADPLRRIRRPLRFAVAACATGLLFLALASLFRGWSYADLAQRHDEAQLALFRGVLPGQRAPLSVKLRLQSEADRLRGASGEAQDVPKPPPALVTLYETLRRLPTELRYRVLEVRVEGDRIYIEGEARSHGDADLVAAALRRGGGIDAQPPKTEQLPPAPAPGNTDRRSSGASGGVAFTLTGTAIHDPPRVAAAAASARPRMEGGAP